MNLSLKELQPRDDYESMDELREHFNEMLTFINEEYGSLGTTILSMFMQKALDDLEDALDELCRQNPDKTRNELFKEEILPVWKEELAENFGELSDEDGD